MEEVIKRINDIIWNLNDSRNKIDNLENESDFLEDGLEGDYILDCFWLSSSSIEDSIFHLEEIIDSLNKKIKPNE